MEYMTTKAFIGAIKELAESKVYIAGAGKYGELLGKYFEKYQIAWDGYVDKFPKAEKINGKKIYSYEEIRSGYYIISSYRLRDEIIKELENIGTGSDHIILYENPKIFFELCDDLFELRRHTERIKKFFKKHVGKRCFIIGNGPSLKIEDLEKTDGEITFASNCIYALYAHTKWRPTYYCGGDPFFCKQMMSDKKSLAMIMDGCEAMFTSATGEGIQYRDDSEIKNLYYIRRVNKIEKSGLPAFSLDCSEQVYLSGTITYDMLQLAVYMGFKQIYLLGMDFNYSVERHHDGSVIKKNISNHMNEIEKEQKQFNGKVSKRYGVPYLADVDIQLAAFQAAKQYADVQDIEIYNATRGGKLEVFPRVDFDVLFHSAKNID